MKTAARFSREEELNQYGEVSLEAGPFSGYAEFRIVGGKREAHWTGRVDLIEDKLLEPLSRRKWALKFAQEHGHKPRCFVNSMSDLFHERLPDSARDRVHAVMALCPEIDFLILTKRADVMEEYYSIRRGLWVTTHVMALLNEGHRLSDSHYSVVWPLSWIWLGVSVEDQKRADERIPHLLRTPAAVRFISAEPLLEHVYMLPSWTTGYDYRGGYVVSAPRLDWVIVGGESGPGARPFNLAWARSIRDQCKAAGVAYYFKQWGSNPWFKGINFCSEVKDKKGANPAEWPKDIRVQEYPR